MPKSKLWDGKAVLDIPMQENDAGVATIRDYLKALVRMVWHENEGFSGKRPFGNSGWEHELYKALAKAKAIRASRDLDGEYDDYDSEAGDKLIRAAIEALS